MVRFASQEAVDTYRKAVSTIQPTSFRLPEGCSLRPLTSRELAL